MFNYVFFNHLKTHNLIDFNILHVNAKCKKFNLLEILEIKRLYSNLGLNGLSLYQVLSDFKERKTTNVSNCFQSHETPYTKERKKEKECNKLLHKLVI